MPSTEEQGETISIAVQLAEVGRELRMRRATYPKWVAAARMDQAEADRRIVNMDAVYRTLKWLQANEGKIKAAFKAEADATRAAE